MDFKINSLAYRMNSIKTKCSICGQELLRTYRIKYVSCLDCKEKRWKESNKKAYAKKIQQRGVLQLRKEPIKSAAKMFVRRAK